MADNSHNPDDILSAFIDSNSDAAVSSFFDIETCVTPSGADAVCIDTHCTPVAPLASRTGFADNERLSERYCYLLDPLPGWPVIERPEVIYETLIAEFPNFGEAIDYICSFACISRHGKVPFTFPPLLLDGPPGIGKTRFAMRVAHLCNAGFDMLNCSGMSGTMALLGSEQGYSEARAGFYANTFKKTELINNIILLDEVEKMGIDSRGGDPYAALLPLLERETASVHMDNCLQESINLGYLSYIMTSNNTHAIPEPMMTRVRMLTIAAPDSSQLDRIVPGVIKDVTKRYNLGNLEFVPDMDEIRRVYRQNHNLRELQAMIEYQIRASLWQPRSERIPYTGSVEKSAMGFGR
ncbi:Lon protease [Komagataeibacter europaeus]|uniref:Lon protease n=1 Tax=Komagataeibacter europaeus TaxID=33995 RepID=A0A0M0EKM5_KOMEU|nr:AAA family ATPase [Komagataeibacter europaeus]KON65819.1 Lon protease [Komagataeibacter europaeus]